MLKLRMSYCEMNRTLISLTLALITLPTWAQSRDPGTAQCSGPSPDDFLRGCSVLISSGGETAENLANDYMLRGAAYFLKERYEQAIADETKAVALKPDYAEAYMNRGLVYKAKGSDDQAIADFSKAIELKPARLRATLYYDRGVAYAHKGLNSLAIADFRAALKIDPAKHEARDQLNRLGAKR